MNVVLKHVYQKRLLSRVKLFRSSPVPSNNFWCWFHQHFDTPTHQLQSARNFQINRAWNAKASQQWRPLSTGSEAGRLLYIANRPNSMRVLVDTGTLVPPSQHHLRPVTRTLQAPSGSTTEVYGQKPLALDPGLERCVSRVFVIANVFLPIHGINFLFAVGLLVVVKCRVWPDRTASPQARGI